MMGQRIDPEKSSEHYLDIGQSSQNEINDGYKYHLTILQHPIRARMCGFGNKDRRPCTPPPILKLSVYDIDGHEVDPSKLNPLYYTVFARLSSEDMEEDIDLVSHKVTESSSQHDIDKFREKSVKQKQKQTVLKSLVGSTVSRASILYDMEGNLGIFFIFHDLSIRKDGVFRLQFSFFDLESNNMISKTLVPVMESVYSDPITVYTARAFPGMVEATPLTLHFFRQGLKIPVRK